MTIADLALTAAGICMGYVKESNPITQRMFHASPEMSAVILAALVGALLLLMWKVKHKVRFINAAVIGLFVIKLAVLALHFNWISQII